MYGLINNSKVLVCRSLAIAPDTETGRQFEEIIAFSAKIHLSDPKSRL